MFDFKAYFYGNAVYINEKYRYNANEILTAYLNDNRAKRILKSDFVGKLKDFKRRLIISPYMDYYDFSEYNKNVYSAMGLLEDLNQIISSLPPFDPSYKTIGKALNMSRNTVCKYVRQLEEKELIATEPTNILTAKGEKRNGNLLYTILPIEQAKKYFYDRQLENLERTIAEDKHRKRLERLNPKPNKQAV